MNQLWSVYHNEIPPFLREFSAAPPMARLKDIGMNCGCEYTSFPLFTDIGPYSRWDHSLGVALIVWHFTGSMAQALAGLFHDIATPVFAHVVDFLNGDHLRQESTEMGTAAWIAASPEIRSLLKRYGLTVEQVEDYHRYPIADNPAPALSADRLEYTLGNLLNYGFADPGQLRAFYDDLTVGEDETGCPELVFRTPGTAAVFAGAALQNSRVYVADEDRFAMQALADLLRLALERGTLGWEELWGTERAVIQKLEADPVCGPAWRRFRGYTRVLRREERPETGYWVRVAAKKRWIDPLARGMGRVSEWNTETEARMEAFLQMDHACWLGAE